ncbi:hypothetical protein [Dietzia sp. PP-33]|uniref:hypothetical protein n=1 Tax=Dietzia sp. PP-33 TaxID=2957500 RepID=UPI0029A5B238|nr:hypothetical protein [Dietzia sp. PP-33]MDX2358516.1 hypothetical protein [Dietzia sp. PP-33]
MNEQFQPRPDDPSSRPYRPAPPDQFAPTEQFPAARFPTEQFPTEQFPVERYDEPQYPAPRYDEPRYQSQRYAEPQQPPHRFAGPPEPLAHEGGFPYGMPPAAPFNPMDQYVPQHLHVPHPYAHGPHPQQFGYPPPMQQTVFVTQNGGKRVNHALHLILTVLTFGLWLPVWMILAITNS